MTKVFIGGSRRVSSIAAEVQRRLDRIIEQGFPVLVGDANGADKALQKYLQSRGYEKVRVFCVGGECRNNLGNWPVRPVNPPHHRKDFDYYAAKDQCMAEEASIGLMIWDGKSAGTLANAARLLQQDKKVVIYAVPKKEFLTLKDQSEWDDLVLSCDGPVREKVRRSTGPSARR